MAQSGYTPIQLYYSTTTTNVPSAGNLANGELAINITDGKLFYKDNGGVVRVIAQTSSVTNVASISFGTTGLTPSTATTGAVTVAGTLATTNGGTGLTSFTANRVFYSSSTSAIGSSANLTFDGTTLTANALTTSSTVTINGGTANGVAYLNSSKVLTTGSALQFDGSNLGLGVTPSAWGSIFKVMQVGGGASYIGGRTDTVAGRQVWLGTNSFYNGTNWIYGVSQPAAQYYQNDGSHIWNTAASGTAGTAITFTQAMTLDASGRLLVGTTTAATQITFNGGDGITYQRSTDNAFPGVLDYLKSRGSAASPTAVQNNDSLFLLRAAPYQGSAYAYLNSMAVEVDGTFTSGQNPPTRITWSTNAANGSSTERSRITSGGQFCINVAGDGYGSDAALIVNGTGRTRSIFSNVNGTGSATHISFNNGNGVVGSITTSGTATAYNTSSDYRLKDDPQPLTNSGAFIDALKPKTWAWKADGSKGVGFIAHEAQEVSPGSVVGEKDAVDSEGKPVYQAMEYGSAEFIANIIAELQSLRARVAALESK